MDTWGWAAVAGSVLALAGIAAWRLRRGTGAAASRSAPSVVAAMHPPPSAEADGNRDRAADAAAAPAPPSGRELTRDLLASAVESSLRDGIAPSADEAARAAIATACAHLLSRPQFLARHLPRRPQLLPRLMRAFNDPEVGLDQIVQIVSEDPALSANLLRIANSAYYRVQESVVENLPRAAALLGLDGMRQVLLDALLQPVLSVGVGPLRRLPEVIWEHTRLTADIAADLARTRQDADAALVAQMAALLHGLGMLVVVQLLRENPQLTPDAMAVARILEEQAAPVAHRIAQSWELPPRIEAALEAQRGERMPTDPVGCALRSGRMLAALAMHCHAGRWTPEQGLALLQAWADQRGLQDDLGSIWRRLHAQD